MKYYFEKNIKEILNTDDLTIDYSEFLYLPILKKEIFLLENEINSLSNEAEKEKILEIYSIGKELINKEKYKEAIKVFLILPNAVSVPMATGYYNLGCAYYYYRKYEEAIKAFEEAITIIPNFKEAYNSLAHAYLKLNMKDKALQIFQKVLKEWPVSKNILFDLGTTCILCQDYKNGIKYLSKEIENYPDKGQTYNNLGFCYCLMGSYKEALDYLEKAVEFSSHYGRPYLNLAFVYFKMGKYKDIIRNLNNLLMFHPNNKFAHILIGFAYKRIDRFYNAVDHYLNAIKFNFSTAQAHLLLALCYIEKGFANNDDKMIEDAIRELNISISLKPEQGRGYLLKGMLYQKKNKNIEAIRLYEKALQCFSNSREINIKYLHAFILSGELLINSGNNSVADIVLKDGIKLFPDNIYLKELLTKIKKE